jgi:hypothetical protein
MARKRAIASGAAPGTYGSATQTVTIAVDALGRVTRCSTPSGITGTITASA